MASKLSLLLLVLGLASCNAIAGYSDFEKVSCDSGECGPAVTSGVKAQTVVVGRKTSCVIREDKSLICWGANPGVTPGTVRTTPGRATKLTKVAQVSIGLEHVCALNDVGELACWGRNENGQLGDGTNAPSPEPKVIAGLPVIDTVTTGDTHSCAYTSPEGDPVQAFCWGQNANGQLGNGNTVDSNVPVKLDLGAGVKIVRLGAGFGYSCAIVKKDGVLETWCWGKNDKGQCGQDPATMPLVPKPTKIEGIPQMERVYPGGSHVCSRTVGEKIPWCWGANDRGQVGVNVTSAFEKPRAVIGGVPIDTIAAGARHTCLIAGDTLKGLCWGANELGQYDKAGADQLTPKETGYIISKSNLSMRQAEHACQIVDGVLTCWGANESGQIGNGKLEPFSQPSKVTLP